MEERVRKTLRRYVHPALPPRNSNPVLLQESTTSLFIVRTLAEKKKRRRRNLNRDINAGDAP